jgi:hypothetical protein
VEERVPLMSNYPPGVTGFERQIAGPSSEVEDTMEVGPCAKFDLLSIRHVTRYGTYALGALRMPKSPGMTNPYRRVRGVVCTFEGGEVEGTLEDHVTFYWDCPVCGQENDTEVEPPEDPRDDYDRADDYEREYGW